MEASVRALKAELERWVQGEVRFTDGDRALYATDASNYRQVPIGVVLPRDPDDVIDAVRVCRAFGVPLTPRGGGTSLAGQCCNVAVILDLSKYMHRVLELDPQGRWARVQPGCVLDDLREAASHHDLTFAPDPSTHSHCTIGGMIGNDSCGVQSVMAGRTADNVEALEVLTPDGVRMRVGATSDAEYAHIVAGTGRRAEIYRRLRELADRYGDLIRERFPWIPRRVSGYNLEALLPEHGFHVARALVGTEGTCVTVLEATVRLVHSPPERVLLVLAYRDIYAAADSVPEVMAQGPIGLEGMDDELVSLQRIKGMHPGAIRRLPGGRGWLVAEFGGESCEEAVARAQSAMEHLCRNDEPEPLIVTRRDEQARIWEIRESGLGATARVPGRGDAWEGWEDSAVAPERLGPYLRDLRRLMEQHGYSGAFYGHFGHGCLHTRIDFDHPPRRSADSQ